MSLNKSIFYTFLTQIPTQALGIVSGIFITRLLGPEGKGIYALFLADVNLFVLFFGLSINSAIVYFVNSEKINTHKVSGISFIIFLLGTIGSILAIIFMQKFGLSQSLLGIDESYKPLFVLVIVNIAVTLLNSIFGGFLQAFKAFRPINQLAFFNSGLNILFFGGVFYLSGINKFIPSLTQIIGLSSFVLGLNCVFYLSAYLKYVKIMPSIDLSFKNDVKPFVKYMGTGHLSQLINFLNYRLDLWIMNYYLFVRPKKFLECNFNKGVKGGVLIVLFILMIAISNVFIANLNRERIFKKQKFQQIEKVERKPSLEGKIRKWFNE